MADHDLIRSRILNINYSGGNFPLVECEDFGFDLDRSTEVAVSTAGPIGFQDDDKGGSFSLNVFATVDPEVNYYRLMESKEIVTFTGQDVDAALNAVGHRVQYRNCRVEKVNAKTSNTGKQMLEVTGKYLGIRVIA